LQLRPQLEILSVEESIASSVAWLKKNPKPDLIMMDIRLSDGLSFEIFNWVEVPSFVIFTTAYDEYAVKAFKCNSIDYLLKPIAQEELEKQLDPQSFFRANRQFIIHIDAVKKVSNHFNGKLKLELQQHPDTEILVSREKAPAFKAWMDY